MILRVLLCAALLAPACKDDSKKSPKQRPTRLEKIDVHTHFSPRAAPRVIGLMNRYGIDVVVNLSGGTPGNGLEQQLAAARHHAGRIVVFANLRWDLPRLGPGYGEAMADDLERSVRMGARGLKIPKGLGLGFSDHTGELIAVDSPQLDPVFERAGALGIPVAIHTGDPVAFWRPPTPDNERYAELGAHPEWSFYGQPVPSWEQLIAALERRIARHPKTTFISVHFGNAPEYPDRVRAWLDKYPNLYIDTAARVPEIGRHPAAEMKQLMIDHGDRILFGTDLGVGTHPSALMLGSTGEKPPTEADVDHFFNSTWRYFETSDRGFAHPTPIQGEWTIDGVGLPREVLEKIYAGNARRVLGLP